MRAREVTFRSTRHGVDPHGELVAVDRGAQRVRVTRGERGQGEDLFGLIFV